MRTGLPDTIGLYRLEGLLGRGGMGEVYLAYDRRLDRRVAIKHVRPDADSDVARARLRREARAAARLSHSAIVQVFELLETEDGDWIVQELVEGTTLASRLSEGALDMRNVLSFGEQIAGALAEAHDKGILHRDLKAENVMVTPSGDVKVLDFGLAKSLVKADGDASLSSHGQVLGTSYAMSPEQARGLSVDARSDLFSLGSLLYQMATGTPPFRGTTMLDTLARINTHHPPSIHELAAGVPEPFSRLVDRLLAKAPGLRPDSARQVAAELRRIAASEAHGDAPRDAVAVDLLDPMLAAETQSLPQPSRRWRSSRRATWLAVAAVVAAGAAARYLPSSLAHRLTPPQQNLAERSDALPAVDAVAEAELTAPALYRRGMELLRRFDRPGNLERARAAFQRMLALDDTSAAAYAGLARTYLYRYRHNSLEPVMLEQAKAAAEQAVRLDEYLADARLSRGLVYLRLGERAAAAAELEEALALDPALADAHRGLGELHESKRDFAAAETAFRAAITLDPNHRLFHDRLGALMFKTGRYEAAEAAFKDSIASAPDSIYGHRGLASTYYLQGRLDEAAVELQKALRIKPSATLYSSLGTIFFSQGLYEKAADAYTKALSSSANNSIYWSNLADAYRQIPDREAETREALLRAEQLLTERIALQPEDATLWSRRALVLAKLGERERALSELARVDRAGTVDTYTRYRVAVGYELCGERGSALEQLETALEAGFSLPEIRRDPELIELRADPRFHRLVVKLDSASPRTDRPASQDRQ